MLISVHRPIYPGVSISDANFTSFTMIHEALIGLPTVTYFPESPVF